MNRSPGPRTALIALLPTLLPAAAAQEPARLDAIVVSASRVELPADEVGSTVTEIGGDELRRRGVQRLEDILDLVPGATVRRTGSIGTPAAVSLRGLAVRNTLVLLDGVEIGDPSRAQVTYEFGTIPVDDIDRIEVLRGPQSTLYGADAAGGVINIVTRRPTKPFEGHAGTEVGTWGTAQASLGIRGSLGRFTYGASAFGFRTDGFSSFPKARGGRERDGHETWAGRAQFGVDLTDRLRTELWLSQSEARVDYDQSNADLFDQYFTKRERYVRSTTTLEAFDGRWTSQFGLAHSSHQRDYKGRQNVSLGDHYDGTRTKLDYLGNVRIAPGHALTFGAEGEWDRLDQDTPAVLGSPDFARIDARARTLGAFAEYRLSPIEGLNLTAGMRRDEHDRFGGATTWRLTGAYRVAATDTKLRASYGTGFVTPSLFELFDPCIGNRSLEAERSRGWDVGIDQHLLGRRVVVSATWFDSRIDDQIRFDYGRPAPAGCPYAFGGYLNVDKVRSRGLEGELRARLDERLDLRGQYTYQNAEDARTGKRLKDVPIHQGAIALDWRFLDRAKAGATVRMRGESDSGFGTGTKAGGFVTADLRLDFEVADGVTLYGRVVNLFDADFEEVYGFATPGRSGYVGTRVRF
ncbi:TonB-dependent receptor plug domain-containing protein [Stella sp.]|uniref:TonB-dependent receptor plug domain-containing protein n=1 Tax=Stella sp. TaxID=2912054 RepID=UPI0035B11122